MLWLKACCFLILVFFSDFPKELKTINNVLYKTVIVKIVDFPLRHTCFLNFIIILDGMKFSSKKSLLVKK